MGTFAAQAYLRLLPWHLQPTAPGEGPDAPPAACSGLKPEIRCGVDQGERAPPGVRRRCSQRQRRTAGLIAREPGKSRFESLQSRGLRIDRPALPPEPGD